VEPAEFVQDLLNGYDPGAGIGWHRDRTVFEHVVGVSLGAAATMRFRRRKPGGFDRATAELAPRSIYHLAGEARHKWDHSIAPMPATRWSITFRTLSQKGRLYTQRIG
jgi:alkylated DNA repair dioxygenase AlkB